MRRARRLPKSHFFSGVGAVTSCETNFSGDEAAAELLLKDLPQLPEAAGWERFKPDLN